MKTKPQSQFHYSYQDIVDIYHKPVGDSFGHDCPYDSTFRGATHEVAQSRLKSGDPAISARLKPDAEILAKKLSISGFQAGMTLDVMGEMPDITRYLSGDPENMLLWCHEESTRPVVRIIVDISVNCTSSAERIERRAKDIFCLAYAVELAGYPLEIIAYGSIQSAKSYFGAGRTDAPPLETACTIKAHNEQLDMPKLAWLLTSAATYRRLFWHAWSADSSAWLEAYHFERQFHSTKAPRYYGKFFPEWLRREDTTTIFIPNIESVGKIDPEKILALHNIEFVRMAA